MTPHDDAMLELVAAHALGAVDAASAECAMVREHLRECAICREEFRIASSAAAAIGMSVAERPPAGLRERIVRALPAREYPVQVTPLRRSRSWFVGAAAAVAIVLAAGAWWANQHRVPTWTAACVPAAANCHASGLLSRPAANRLHLQISGLASLPAGKAYQTWVIVPGKAPKPEPLLVTDARGNGSVDIAFAPPQRTIVAVTVEPARGSLQPTSKPFLTATVE